MCDGAARDRISAAASTTSKNFSCQEVEELVVERFPSASSSWAVNLEHNIVISEQCFQRGSVFVTQTAHQLLQINN